MSGLSMRSPTIHLGLTILFLLSACTANFQDVSMTNVPVTTFRAGKVGVDTDIVFDNVSQVIREKLPNAYFLGMVFSGKCQNLPGLQGRLILSFVQVRTAIPRQQVVMASAFVDTVQQTMDIEYLDYSRYEVSTRGRTFPGDQFVKSVAADAHRRITELGLCNDDITLTQLDGSWDVRCGELGNFVQNCRFGIINGVIQDNPE